MVLISEIILVLIAGILNGLMDAIQSHDAYKHWGYWFSKDSWHMSKWFNSFAPNAWHFAKYAMMSILLGLIVFAPAGLWWHYPVLILSFMVGFNISYK